MNNGNHQTGSTVKKINQNVPCILPNQGSEIQTLPRRLCKAPRAYADNIELWGVPGGGEGDPLNITDMGDTLPGDGEV